MIDEPQGPIPGVRLLEPDCERYSSVRMSSCTRARNLHKKGRRLGTSRIQNGGVFQREQFTACFTNYIR